MREIRGGGPPSSADLADIPESLSALTARTRPIQIVYFDIDDLIDEFRFDEHYGEAWIIACKNEVPLGMATIELSADASQNRERLSELRDSLRKVASETTVRLSIPDDDLPPISVVVPTNVFRIQALEQCVSSLEQLDYPNFEVLLVDNRRDVPSPDALATIVRGRTWLRVVREPSPGVAAARNKGVASAKSEVIAMVDDDVQVNRQWLRAIGARMTLEPKLDAVTGLVMPAELETPAQIWFEHYYGGFGSSRKFAPATLEADDHVPRFLRGSQILARDWSGAIVGTFPVYGIGAYAAGANMAFRKAAIDRAGGFDTALGTGTVTHGGEDLATLIQILWTGGQLGYEPAAFVHHQHRRRYLELVSQVEGNGLGLTALLTSLVRNDPRHILGLSSQLRGALKRKAEQRAERLRGVKVGGKIDSAAPPLYPPDLVKREFRHYPLGPFAYFRSRREHRKK